MAMTDLAEVRSRMMDRDVLAREAAEEQRQEHLIAEQVRAEAKTEELDKLLGAVPEAERRRIRLEAAVLMTNRSASTFGAIKQLQYDELTLELARYSITGAV